MWYWTLYERPVTVGDAVSNVLSLFDSSFRNVRSPTYGYYIRESNKWGQQRGFTVIIELAAV
jgi:hypothetical protein